MRYTYACPGPRGTSKHCGRVGPHAPSGRRGPPRPEIGLDLNDAAARRLHMPSISQQEPACPPAVARPRPCPRGRRTDRAADPGAVPRSARSSLRSRLLLLEHEEVVEAPQEEVALRGGPVEARLLELAIAAHDGTRGRWVGSACSSMGEEPGADPHEAALLLEGVADVERRGSAGPAARARPPRRPPPSPRSRLRLVGRRASPMQSCLPEYVDVGRSRADP